MEIDIITMEELLQVKQEIVAEIKQALETRSEKTESRLWFRSAEVRKMLNISPGTLQNLRINGTLPYRKIGGTIFYNRADIQRMMSGGHHD